MFGVSSRSGMIWTDVIEEYPDNTHIHPHYSGQGHDGRKYRPGWHAVVSAMARDDHTHYCRDCECTLELVADGRDDNRVAVVCGHCGGTNTLPLLPEGER